MALQKKAFSRAAPDSADYQYWKEKGWLEPEARFYVDARINAFQRAVAWLIARMMLVS